MPNKRSKDKKRLAHNLYITACCLLIIGLSAYLSWMVYDDRSLLAQIGAFLFVIPAGIGVAEIIHVFKPPHDGDN